MSAYSRAWRVINPEQKKRYQLKEVTPEIKAAFEAHQLLDTKFRQGFASYAFHKHVVAAWVAYCSAIEQAICEQHGLTYNDMPNDPSDGQQLVTDSEGHWELITSEEAACR